MIAVEICFKRVFKKNRFMVLGNMQVGSWHTSPEIDKVVFILHVIAQSLGRSSGPRNVFERAAP
jgi:hypothetical protein